jgi:hypothetical protein
MAPRNNQSSAVSCDKCRSLKVKCVREDTQATCAKYVHTAISLTRANGSTICWHTDETLKDAQNLDINAVPQSDHVIEIKGQP